MSVALAHYNNIEKFIEKLCRKGAQNTLKSNWGRAWPSTFEVLGGFEKTLHPGDSFWMLFWTPGIHFGASGGGDRPVGEGGFPMCPDASVPVI